MHSIRETDRLFVAIPMRFVTTISHLMSVLLTGATIIGAEHQLSHGNLGPAIDAANATAVGTSPLQTRWLSESAVVTSGAT